MKSTEQVTPGAYPDQLDALDAARAAATPGPWAQHGADPSYVIGDIGGDGETYLDVADTEAGDRADRGDADAALIVAAVNALPKLTAALRAVLDLIDPEAGLATGNGYDATRLFSEQQIRAAVTAALGGAA